MLLTVDIGNTNITLGAYDKDLLVLTARLATSAGTTADEYAVMLKNILELHDKCYTEIEDAIISSVVPSVAAAMKRAITLLCDIIPLEIGPGIKTGLNIKIDNPAQLGADMVAGAVAAINEYNLPCAVIDMGTATTISVIDRNGAFIGAIIGAGLRLTMKALAQNTAQLPAIDIKKPQSVIGKNTADSMKSGLVYGSAAMLDGLLDRIADELGEKPTVIATGGYSKEIIKLCKNEIIYNENLLLDGLKEIYERNK